ncbi:MAG TPA: pseudouridine-5'-phosphate glycosidase, partial [candidate division Zixibacteria bacterium]|nr:pseudouridine-5'-phosphate glycosidase [candidate division Zixibacteria bacterium]
MEQSIQYHPNVARAITEQQALVALESTIITHGLPYPTNAEAATIMENAVRESGATPAIMAIIQGRIYAGLSSGQLEYISKQTAGSVRKCSRRDLAIALAQGEDGGTTVAGTMILAEMAGIELFATGGIGGVHRG